MFEAQASVDFRHVKHEAYDTRLTIRGFCTFCDGWACATFDAQENPNMLIYLYVIMKHEAYDTRLMTRGL